MNELVTYSLQDGIATLMMANGKVNAVSPDLVTAMNQALDRAEADKAVVIVTGQPGILSAGFDLKVMTSSPQSAIQLVADGFTLSRRLLAHPTPVVMACTGHAMAMGAFLLLSADYRIGVEGPFNIGLNEVKIGMTMPDTGIALARDRLAGPVFQRAVCNAELFTPQGAITAGFLDKVVAIDALEAAALDAAQQLQKLNMTAHKNTKRKLRKDLFAAMEAGINADRASVA